MLQIEAQLTDTDYLLSDGLYKELFSKNIPDGGTEILGILKIGIVSTYGIGVNSRIQGRAFIDIGVAAKLPDNGQIHASLGNTEQNKASGFWSGPLQPFLRIKSLTSNLDLDLYSDFRISIGANLFDFIHGEASLNFRIPFIRNRLIVGYSKYLRFLIVSNSLR